MISWDCQTRCRNRPAVARVCFAEGMGLRGRCFRMGDGVSRPLLGGRWRAGMVHATVPLVLLIVSYVTRPASRRLERFPQVFSLLKLTSKIISSRDTGLIGSPSALWLLWSAPFSFVENRYRAPFYSLLPFPKVTRALGMGIRIGSMYL